MDRSRLQMLFFTETEGCPRALAILQAGVMAQLAISTLLLHSASSSCPYFPIGHPVVLQPDSTGILFARTWRHISTVTNAPSAAAAAPYLRATGIDHPHQRPGPHCIRGAIPRLTMMKPIKQPRHLCISLADRLRNAAADPTSLFQSPLRLHGIDLLGQCPNKPASISIARRHEGQVVPSSPPTAHVPYFLRCITTGTILSSKPLSNATTRSTAISNRGGKIIYPHYQATS